MEPQIQYKYIKIDTQQFAIFEENITADMRSIPYELETQFSYDSGRRVLSNKMVVRASKDDKPVLKADVRSYFEIDAESIDALRVEGSIVFPVSILVQFASFNYGTMRGIIHSKAAGTPLGAFILPPAYLQELIKKPFEVRETVTIPAE